MLGIIINSLMFCGVLISKINREVCVMIFILFNVVVELYICLCVVYYLDNGYIVIFGGGNG